MHFVLLKMIAVMRTKKLATLRKKSLMLYSDCPQLNSKCCLISEILKHLLSIKLLVKFKSRPYMYVCYVIKLVIVPLKRIINV